MIGSRGQAVGVSDKNRLDVDLYGVLASENIQVLALLLTVQRSDTTQQDNTLVRDAELQ